MSAKNAYQHNLRRWSDIVDHLPKLYHLAKGNCLEIGVRYGISTSALLAGLEENGGHLWSVDIDDCRTFTGHPKWTFIQSDSIKGAEAIKKSVPAKLDLLFVDGDHTYEGALSDLENFGSRAKVILVHDTDAPDFPGVHKAVMKYCADTGRMVRFHGKSFGMAEIG